MKTHTSLTVLFLVAAPFGLSAGAYSEATDGDLSGNGASPTAITFSLGVNTVSGRMGRGAVTPGQTDADIWTFNIGNGQQLTGITVTQLDPSGSLVTGSFLAIAAGTSIGQSTAAGHLSNMLVSSTGDILDSLASKKLFSAGFGSPSGTSGVTSPLGAGDYTVWFQEAGQASVGYTLSFNVQPVPEPSALALGAAGLSCLCGMRRKR